MTDAVSADGHDRRAAYRIGFTSIQQVAFGHYTHRPSDGEFEKVVCSDLSPTGIAFYRTSPPPSELLVVRLQQEPVDAWVKAKVIRVSAVPSTTKGMLLVGCEFLGTL